MCTGGEMRGGICTGGQSRRWRELKWHSLVAEWMERPGFADARDHEASVLALVDVAILHELPQ